MNNIKYIYFEVYWVQGNNPIESRIQNENILQFKPHTNSNGVWGYRNVSKSGDIRWVTVDQYWIDLEKYKLNKTNIFYMNIEDYNKWVELCLDKLNIKLRKNKLENILK